jgi:hypothetical protein
MASSSRGKVPAAQDAETYDFLNALIMGYAKALLTVHEDGQPLASPIVRARNRQMENFRADVKALEFSKKEKHPIARDIYTYWKDAHWAPNHYPNAMHQINELIKMRAQVSLIDDVLARISSDSSMQQDLIKVKNRIIQNHDQIYNDVARWVKTLPPSSTNTISDMGPLNINTTAQVSHDASTSCISSDEAVEFVLALERISHTTGLSSMGSGLDQVYTCAQTACHIAQTLPATEPALLDVISKHRGSNPVIWLIDQIRKAFRLDPLQWSTGHHKLVQPLQQVRNHTFFESAKAKKEGGDLNNKGLRVKGKNH